MYVPAEAYKANLVTGLFTHFRRGEDRSMERGKFEEELQRMSQILEVIEPHSFVLMNESFSATNEREGSEVAHQVVTALLEAGVKVAFVTHFYEFARRASEHPGLPSSQSCHPLFLVAERLPDGRRTYRIKEGIPQKRSYGEDLYHKIFHPTVQRLTSV
jgi:DNA mismatch repair ATPase MutS